MRAPEKCNYRYRKPQRSEIDPYLQRENFLPWLTKQKAPISVGEDGSDSNQYHCNHD